MIVKIMFILFVLCNSLTAQKNSVTERPLLKIDSSLYQVTSSDSICARTQMYVKARNKYNIIGSKIDVLIHLLGKPDEFEHEFHLRTQKMNNVYIYKTASCFREDSERRFQGKVIIYSEDGLIIDVLNFYGG